MGIDKCASFICKAKKEYGEVELALKEVNEP